MKNLLQKLRTYILVKLLPRKIVGVKLEGITVNAEATLDSVSMGIMTIEGQRRFASIHIHYFGAPITSKNYDDLEMAQRDYAILANMLIASPLSRTNRKAE